MKIINYTLFSYYITKSMQNRETLFIVFFHLMKTPVYFNKKPIPTTYTKTKTKTNNFAKTKRNFSFLVYGKIYIKLYLDKYTFT